MNTNVESTSILYNTIVEYLGPIIEQTGYVITSEGFLEKPGDSGEHNRIMYQNPKFVQGTVDPSIPPILIPKIPITDRDYLNIRLTPNYDLFSPFTYFKHMAIILLKFKDVLAPFWISAADDCHGEDDFDKFKDCITIGDKINDKGEYQIDLVSYENKDKPIIIESYASEDIVKSMFGLCVNLYINYVIPGKPVPAKYKNIDRTWSHIKREMEKWDKARISISQLSKSNDKANGAAPEVDLSLAVSDSETTAEDIAIANFNQNYYVEMDNCEDPHDPKLQKFLISLMYPDGNIPYVKPDEDRRPNPVVEEKVLTPMENEVIKINDDIAKENMKNTMESERKIEEETHCHSIISMRKPSVQQNQNPMMNNNMMGMPGMMGGMGMNPMMGMNMGMGFMGGNNLPPTNVNEICLTHIVDPYANYR